MQEMSARAGFKQIHIWLLPLFVVMITIAIYGIPVWLAYQFASTVEPLAEGFVIEPVKQLTAGSPGVIQTMLVGDFGLVSLGLFSFVWAFPVVLFVGLSIAVTEHSRLQQHLIYYMEPALKKAGLSGGDFAPVIAGYGCNVVAIMQAEGCRACHTKRCASMISFGSACSYQIGATLSIFNAAAAPWLFIPYLVVLFTAGALHTRVWYGKDRTPALPAAPRSIQLPDLKKVGRQVNSLLSQFFKQAMPIFLLICLIVFLLDELAVTDLMVRAAQPLLALFTLPPEGAFGIIFSIFRKDGILLFNEGGGAILAAFSLVEIFILVYLASTLSGCLVTMWTIAKQSGRRFAVTNAAKQLATSLVTAGIMLLFLRTAALAVS